MPGRDRHERQRSYYDSLGPYEGLCRWAEDLCKDGYSDAEKLIV